MSDRPPTSNLRPSTFDLRPPTSDFRPPTSDSRLPAPDPADRRFLLRRAVIAPLCLCLVAGLHAFRVVAYGQTQWKGGGFGMFSTIDSEASRFVRAFAMTPEGELPLAIPRHLEKTVAELRAAPTQAKIDGLAGRLAAIHWRRPDERLVREAQRWSHENTQPVHLPQPTIGLFRSLEAIPANEPPEHALNVSAVRVECWRTRFDRNATEGVPYSARDRNITEGVPYSGSVQLRGEKIREATAEAPQ
ncbi:MAG: hypothetical protein L0211_21935 [Planctomycetaceae bacterium]|nr:hypothetical protein [Planctomycetaceae bacterium]